MKFKTYLNTSNWDDQAESVDSDRSNSSQQTSIIPESEGIDRVLLDIVHSENLIVLAGSGTSMCVEDPLIGPKAPTMSRPLGSSYSNMKITDTEQFKRIS